MFEIQKPGDKTSFGEIDLDIRTHASPKVGQDQVSGGVSVLCRMRDEIVSLKLNASRESDVLLDHQEEKSKDSKSTPRPQSQSHAPQRHPKPRKTRVPLICHSNIKDIREDKLHAKPFHVLAY